MISFPNAKINLGLHVVSRLASGYHAIETIFYPIPLCDALEITPSDAFTFRPSGLKLEGPEADNLVVRAMRQLYPGEPPPIAVHLHKAIPCGAGLGGGSSNAAFMLRMLNETQELQLSLDELESKAATIGADCPFFVRNRPVFATGTGNIFAPIELSLAGMRITLVKPSFGVSTAEAYAGIIPREPLYNIREIIDTPVSKWPALLHNDFEDTVIKSHPQIGKIKDALYKEGALYASMSGSGSAVYGIFDKETSLRRRFPDCFVWEGELS
ncbi:MAG: 4-(cytidine 5'-diphospho)-2-C-methyl-D-erythritol kinase [Tannerellaceae bacterium]|jgi:4-diphosphocytidyl-2-C-methyl-D-erythritol kinase|nr:4-(cytidine 5'-diphospho)-2-C-methyl-D-erythritol kinase [Tannerellaceae bacterium]